MPSCRSESLERLFAFISAVSRRRILFQSLPSLLHLIILQYWSPHFRISIPSSFNAPRGPNSKPYLVYSFRKNKKRNKAIACKTNSLP